MSDAISDALAGLTVDTAGELPVGRLIDHIGSSDQLTPTSVDPWSNVIDGHRISDHSGVAVTYER